MESKNELTKRWEKDDLVSTVLNNLRKGDILKSNLSTINGRIDLRGFPFPQPEKKEKMRSFEMVYTRIVLKKVTLNSIDFSYSNLSYLEFDECSLENCYFEESVMRSMQITATAFSNVVFRNVNFTDSFMNSNNRENAGYYRNVEFINCNLKSTSFSFPYIQHCIFDNCKIDEVQFDGSRLEKVRFIGKIQSAWFNGYSIFAKTSSLNIFRKFEPKNYPNKMRDVDFSQAELIDVTFSYGVDLTNCMFPNDDKYLYISNQSYVYSELQKEINSSFDKDERIKAIKLLDNVFFKELKLGQEENLLNSEHKLWKDDPLSQKIFRLIREIQQDKSLLNDSSG